MREVAGQCRADVNLVVLCSCLIWNRVQIEKRFHRRSLVLPPEEPVWVEASKPIGPETVPFHLVFHGLNYTFEEEKPTIESLLRKTITYYIRLQ